MTALSTSGLTVLKGQSRILDGVTCTFPSGKLAVIIGPNGAGKSTLLRVLTGLEPTAEGQVILGGRDVTHAASHLRSKVLTWVPAESDVPFAFTARECVVMGRFPWHQGLPTSADYARADQALSLLGMGDFASREVPTLSSGERLKVQVARALAGDASCLLFDEPTANLDIGASLHLLTLLKQIAGEGRTIVVTLHDLSLARRFADHAVCLNHGRVVAEGDAAHTIGPATIDAVFGVVASTCNSPKGFAGLIFDI